MLAFAKDISRQNPTHPEESQFPQLKTYMDYQRKLNHERLVYHSLDEAKSLLGKIIEESGGSEEKLKERLKKDFPVTREFADADTILLMLRKLVNAQNSTNNWYRMNEYFFALVYDCVEGFLRKYNDLVREQSAKVREYNISDGVEVDFDDWVLLYFHNLDFLLEKQFAYVHFIFKKRNMAIREALSAQIKGGISKESALEAIKDDFGIDPCAIKIISQTPLNHKDLELFYTSVENPIYEDLYDSNSSAGFMDGESLADHSYFLAHQLKGLSEENALTVFQEIERLSQK
jgi:hypothetical protein